VAPKKLSFKEKRELEELPKRIEALEAEEQQLNARVASAGFYKEGAEAIAATMARIEAIAKELGATYARWHELEERSGSA
jgi:ATP-binding cassette subfamily F protein uup